MVAGTASKSVRKRALPCLIPTVFEFSGGGGGEVWFWVGWAPTLIFAFWIAIEFTSFLTFNGWLPRLDRGLRHLSEALLRSLESPATALGVLPSDPGLPGVYRGRITPTIS